MHECMGTVGLVDVTDVAVEELLRRCPYLREISVQQRYIMPSTAHGKHFDSFRREKDARKKKRKARSKDAQFSKKERSILNAVDKMMAEEQQYVIKHILACPVCIHHCVLTV